MLGKSDSTLHAKAYRRGLRAQSYSANPYLPGTALHSSWVRGYRDRWVHGHIPPPTLGRMLVRTALIAGAALGVWFLSRATL